MSWSINQKNWHCHHPLGISLYFDPKPTKSGAIRVLGPWIPQRLNREDFKDAMLEIVTKIEGNGEYAVFGGYQDKPTHSNYSFPILGSICGYVPSVMVRSTMILRGSGISQNEWVKVADEHRCGLKRQEWGLKDVDKDVVHPAMIGTDFSRLFDVNLRKEKLHAIEFGLCQKLSGELAA